MIVGIFRLGTKAVLQSLGPRGMDKMVPYTYSTMNKWDLTILDTNGERRDDNRGFQKPKERFMAESCQTNDGNTMLKDMSVMHPAAKMLVDLSAAQDVEAGDGTTSVVVIAGSLLGAADKLLAKGERCR